VNFAQSDESNSILLCLTCPDCKNHFGIDNGFIDKTGETAFIFTCPVCNTKGKLPS
jgi:hypothetical protein